MLLLAAATRSSASEKKSASDAKLHSDSAVHRADDRRASLPETESVRVTSPDELFTRRDIRIDPNFPSVASPTTDERLLVELINVERKTRGLKPVAWDGMLTQLARLHGADMRDVRKASHHSSKDGADFGMRLARIPYRAEAAAENVAYNSNVLRAHRALMDSPGHRHNILDPSLTAIGTAVVGENGGDWVYVVEDFATPITTVSDEEAARKMREALVRAGTSWHHWAIPEDKAVSKRLGGLLEKMVESGTVRNNVGGSVGMGWTLAFTSMDPNSPPKSALQKIAKAESYALAVTFRKTARYPFGAYWAILYLKGDY
jgi:uncharacterized protein YkwD